MAKAEMERPLPHSNDAERAILGAVLLSATAAIVAFGSVAADDFFFAPHQRIFRTAQQLAAQGRAVDLLTMTEALTVSKELEMAGGAAYLASLLDGVPRVSNVEHYAGIVKEKAQMRRLIYAASAIREQAFDGEGTAGEIAERAVASVLATGSANGAARSWGLGEAAKAALDDLKAALKDPGSVALFNSDLTALDELTGGLRRQELALMVGITSHGKTLLGMQYAAAADRAGYRVQYHSAEMSAKQLAMRELAHRARVPLWLTRRPTRMRRAEEKVAALEAALAGMQSSNVQVVDQDITPARVRAMAEAAKRTTGLDLVIVDYDQLVVRAGMRRSAREEDFYDEQAGFVHQALEMAKRLDICFVLLCQPRKVDAEVARGKRSPRVEDIFGTSASANAAHHILWVVRKFFQKDMQQKFERDATVYVLKARNDRPGMAEVEFDPDLVRFVDAPPKAEEIKPRRGGREPGEN